MIAKKNFAPYATPSKYSGKVPRRLANPAIIDKTLSR